LTNTIVTVIFTNTVEVVDVNILSVAYKLHCTFHITDTPQGDNLV